MNLDFSGGLTAHVTGTAVPDDLIPDECTGNNSARLGSWASTMALTIGRQRYALVVLVSGYRGAAAFTANTSVEVNSADKSRVWQNGRDDPVTFTVGSDEQSGLLEATLSNTATPASKLHLSGHWSCQP